MFLIQSFRERENKKEKEEVNLLYKIVFVSLISLVGSALERRFSLVIFIIHTRTTSRSS